MSRPAKRAKKILLAAKRSLIRGKVSRLRRSFAAGPAQGKPARSHIFLCFNPAGFCGLWLGREELDSVQNLGLAGQLLCSCRIAAFLQDIRDDVRILRPAQTAWIVLRHGNPYPLEEIAD